MKYQSIVALYQKTIREITASPENWMGFLQTASQNFRLPFDEQLLVYAQRPDATAVLTTERWNKNFGRWVKRGSRGIAVFDQEADRLRVKYYFDVSDTEESRYKRLVRPVPLWSLEEPDVPLVIETLENTFGGAGESETLVQAIIHTSVNAVSDNLADYFEDLNQSVADSRLEELDALNRTKAFRDLITNSMAYMLMFRCGIETDGSFEPEDFRVITDFNTPEVVNIVGTASCEITAMALSPIAATVRSLHKEEQHTRTFAKSEKTAYNETQEIKNTHERSVNHDHNLQKTGRLRTAEPDRTAGNANAPGQIRKPAESLPETASLRPVSELNDPGSAQRALNRDTGNRQSADGTDHQTADDRRGRERSPESKRSDEVGGTGEQHSSGRGRTDPDRADLHLEHQRPVLAQGTLDEVLRITPHLRDPHKTICAVFEKQTEAEPRVRYLKRIFNSEITELTLQNGQSVFYHALDEALHLWTEANEKRTAEEAVPWRDVADHLVTMIRQNTFTDDKQPIPSEKEQLRRLDDQAEEQVSSAFLVPEKPATHRRPPLEFQLGDTVLIGTDRYEILFLSDETVSLGNVDYPLLTKTLTREDFDRRVAETPGNPPRVQPDTKEKNRAASKPTMPDAQTADTRQPSQNHTEEKENMENRVSAQEKAPAPSHPTKPAPEQRHQYRITEDQLGIGGPKVKFQANLAAIRALKQCEAESRLATPEEQECLAKYVGWGGLAEVFDPEKSTWSNENAELKSLLSDDEYTAARASTLTAFYTPHIVAKAMYAALAQMGFQAGNLLEPACGIGHFMGLLPESMSDSKIYGVELDPISGRIARQLYQNADIRIEGFERTDFPDSFFDVAIGNVPYGQIAVADKRYDQYHFAIHDYFFAKALDKVRPGGVIAFITSKYTLDKKNSAVRRYLAERADLIGAIRLPNDTFKAGAGTEVTADILFLQKKDHRSQEIPEWISLGNDKNNIEMNTYFIEHPEMIMGEMVLVSSAFGPDSQCQAIPGKILEDQLSEAIKHLNAEIPDNDMKEADVIEGPEEESLPADPSVRNFSYTLVDAKIYYRENSRMRLVTVSKTADNRIRGMIDIRDCARKLIELQVEDAADETIKKQQANLSQRYDAYTRKYGRLTARGNRLAFDEDSSYPLLCSLEILDEEGKFLKKADMFTRRTIMPRTEITQVSSASEALAASLSEKACVDLDYMAKLMGEGETVESLVADLQGTIFKVPETGPFMEMGDKEKKLSESWDKGWQTSDEYLSGNVREKLKIARLAAESNPAFQINVQFLEKVQPPDLSAAEISVRLGATWIPEKDIEAFIFDLLSTPDYARRLITVHYSRYTGAWNIEGKNRDASNIKVRSTYGTTRKNAYAIIEDSLNLRDVKVFDYLEEADGKKKSVLNKKETTIALEKQTQIKEAFKNWIWKDPERRKRLTAYYNETFNAIRPRTYDGSFLKFEGMNPEISLRKHQIDGAARIIFGGNTLLAYVVGAGKTFTMVAAAMELKHIGLCHKSIIVVPNHIIEQFAAEWLQLYPAANILATTRRDFEKKNRKRFCAKIATGDYDAVIIGHSQFEKIPLSTMRQIQYIHTQIDEISKGIEEMKRQQGARFTVKQMEKSRKNLQVKLEKLNDQSRKDDLLTFEELGIDRLFVDEADSYKNLYAYSKMRNVGGIAQTEALKSADLFMKTQYLDELTGGKGVVFATGTPISNTMVELYTMQRYLQYNTLKRARLSQFDAWASTFGETVSSLELAPEGNSYRLKTRFAKFYNLPELMTMFREVADIQTAEMLNLPVPKAHYEVIKTKPSAFQEAMLEELVDRAEKVRNQEVEPHVDNMLRITGDGRKLALDQRILDDTLPDDPDSKVNACVKTVYEIWEKTKAKKRTQLLFCDLSTPKKDGHFNVYEDIRAKLIDKGIPKEEIAFIHEAHTEQRKKALFGKVRKGTVRILMGSTFKMGAGTNVQDRIIASHDLDCPWRPRDLEQRGGRTIRQGNQNPEVYILRYVTENTFDAYSYQTLEKKQHFISQIMTGKNPVRSAEDVDNAELSYAEIKSLATGNPLIKEKMDLDIEITKLQTLKQSFLTQKYDLEDRVLSGYPMAIRDMKKKIEGLQADVNWAQTHTPDEADTFPEMCLNQKSYPEKKEAGEALLAACKEKKDPEAEPLGSYRGFEMDLVYSVYEREFQVILKHTLHYKVPLGSDAAGNIKRIDNRINRLEKDLAETKERLGALENEFCTAQKEVQKTFQYEKDLTDKTARLARVEALLNMNKPEYTVLDTTPEAGDLPKANFLAQER